MRKLVESKPKGKKSAYNCFMQSMRDQHKEKNPEKSLVIAEFSKITSEKWKNMSDDEKQKYRDLADEDRQRYEDQMKSYVPTTDTAKAKKRKAPKDPNKPKRPPTAFFIFSAEKRASVREQNPEMKITEVASVLGKMWKEITDKSKYEALAKEAAEKRNEEIKVYEEKHIGEPAEKMLHSDESDDE